ncbi:MAG: type II toxin-antitoxin system Phd/YefM family antitoxin [Beijerinckiaceae bacterium]
MPSWPVPEAKARFSDFLEKCLARGPQIVTKREAETAVLVPLEEWKRLNAAARPSLKEWLLSEEARFDLDIPARDGKRRKPAPDLACAHVTPRHQRRV